MFEPRHSVELMYQSDDSAPSFDHNTAAAFGVLGIPAFACAPDRLPEPIAAAISRQDVAQWAA